MSLRFGHGLILTFGALVACGDSDATDDTTSTASASTGATAATSTTAANGSTQATASSASTSSGTGGAADPGPDVDTSDPQLYDTRFTADEADPEATTMLATQIAMLDTRATPRGLLVVYLHGAGAPGTCGSAEHSRVLAAMGFHVIDPCYTSNYGVDNCDDDIEGCRLEAFEGVDHHPFIDIAPPESIEVRVTKGLAFAQAQNPEGDWTYFVDGDAPKWSRIIISGISHGASTSGVIGLHRAVSRVVMLSGPLDTNQAWLAKPTMTPIDRFYGFTHTDDGQHEGHLEAFETMGLPGTPVVVDDAMPPYGDSHRLVTSAPTGDGHGSTQAGGSSPKEGEDYVFLPVWAQMYTSP